MNSRVSNKTRGLSIATGCVTAVVGCWRLGTGFAIVPAFLVVGAIVQPRFPRVGRVLLSSGALALSLWVILLLLVPESIVSDYIGFVALKLISVLLVGLCDLTIVTEEIRLRRGQHALAVPPVSAAIRWLAFVTGCVTALTGLPVLALASPIISGFMIVGVPVARRFPQHGRDLIRAGAIFVTLWVIPVSTVILDASRSGGRDPRVVAAAAVSLLLVVWCDIALVVEAIRLRRIGNPGQGMSALIPA